MVRKIQLEFLTRSASLQLNQFVRAAIITVFIFSILYDQLCSWVDRTHRNHHISVHKTISFPPKNLCLNSRLKQLLTFECIKTGSVRPRFSFKASNDGQRREVKTHMNPRLRQSQLPHCLREQGRGKLGASVLISCSDRHGLMNDGAKGAHDYSKRASPYRSQSRQSLLHSSTPCTSAVAQWTEHLLRLVAQWVEQQL